MWRGSPSILTLQIWYVATSVCPWHQTDRQTEEDADTAKQEPSANMYWCQNRSACRELFLAIVGPVPTAHNKKKTQTWLTPSSESRFHLIKTQCSLHRWGSSYKLCAHTDTNKNTYEDSPPGPCDVMGAAEEIQEVINNRLFSQENKKSTEPQSSGNLWNPSVPCQLLIRCKPFIMSAVAVGMLLFFSVALFLFSFSHILALFSLINPGYSGNFP